MSSDQGNTLTHTLVAEPYSSVQVRMGALQAVLYSRNRVGTLPRGTVYVGRGRMQAKERIAGLVVEAGRLWLGPLNHSRPCVPARSLLR